MFSPELILTEGLITIVGELRHRLCNVLRMRPGERFILRDASGAARVVSVVSLSRSAVTLANEGMAQVAPPPPIEIAVAQAIGKGDRFEQVLQHGTELGVGAFIPVLTRRTVRRITGHDGRDRVLRWRRILEHAAEQSQRDAVPRLWDVCSLDEAVARTRDSDRRYVLSRDGGTRLGLVATLPRGAKVTLFVGPEGGLDSDEMAMLEANHIEAASVGAYMLRTETAALAAVAILMNQHYV